MLEEVLEEVLVAKKAMTTMTTINSQTTNSAAMTRKQVDGVHSSFISLQRAGAGSAVNALRLTRMDAKQGL